MSRDKIYSVIKKKAAKLKELRTNTNRSMTPSQIMMRYMQDVEVVKKTSDTQQDYHEGLNKATTLMDNRLRAFDIDAHTHVQWSDSDDWKRMSVTGIRIVWSDEYIANNPGENKETTIDIGHLFMEGLFD